MRKIILYLFLPFLFLLKPLQGQVSTEDLVNSVFNLKVFTQQQDRHIDINDSLDRLSQYKLEFEYLCKIYKRCVTEKNKKVLGIVMISLGNFHNTSSNYSAALDTFNRAIKLYEDLQEMGGLSTVHANMGNTYFYLNDLDKALVYYKQSISDIKKSSLDESKKEGRLANCYNSLGGIYCSKNDYVFGKTYFDLAFNIWRKNGDSISMAYIYNNYAQIFQETREIDSAFFYSKKARDLKMRHGDAYDKADANNNLSSLYLSIKKPKEALNHALIALNLLDTTIYSRTLNKSYALLTETYGLLKDYKNELKYYKKYRASNDSADVKGQNSELSRKELRDEFDKIHLADSIRSIEEIKLKDLKISAKNTQSYFLIFILILTVIALSLIYSRFKLTKKQKHIIEQKNKEITDSINYAKKIQQSILPSEKYFNKEIKRLRGEK